MPSIPVPKILDLLARAGEAGKIGPQSDEEGRAVELCRTWGFPITTINDRLYLAFDRDLMVPAWIEAEVPALAWDKLCVEGFFETASTNDEAANRARQGAPGGTLIYAESQTAGKGRNRRAWISLPRTGLYFSLIVRPKQGLHSWPLLTLVASVAVAAAIQEFWQVSVIHRCLDLELKWPNDLLIFGRKSAGILVETAGVGGSISAAIVGVGINVNQGGLPAELREQATSVSDEAGMPVPRRDLLVRFLSHFQAGLDLFERGDRETILMKWKGYSRMWKDTPIWIVENGGMQPAVTAGLTEAGALIVRRPGGEEVVILAGDVSIRRSVFEERQ